MTGLIRRLAAVLPVAVLALGASLVGVAAAEGETTGPVVSLSSTTVSTGDRILVTIDGFAAPTVTVSVCGNDARRGSGDCNLVKSKGVRIDPAVSPTITKFGVSEPPYGCPCLVRVSSINGDEVAVAPITLVGHSVEPVVSAPNVNSPFVAVAVTARPAARGAIGWTRSNLGGPLGYEVTVTVRNLTTEPIHPRLSGFVSRSANQNETTLPLADPDEIGVGQTWRQTVSMTLPAPSFGSVQWRVTSSGAGPTVTSTSTTSHRPVLLIVIVLLLALDIGFLAIRLLVRRHAARAATQADGVGPPHDPSPENEPIDVESWEFADSAV